MVGLWAGPVWREKGGPRGATECIGSTPVRRVAAGRRGGGGAVGGVWRGILQ